MWKPATMAMESMISWFVNRVLIGEIQGTPEMEEVRAFLDALPTSDPRDFFRVERPAAQPHHWHWKYAKRNEQRVDFGFPSDVVTGEASNDRVRGIGLLHPNGTKGPAMILVHGWITPDHTPSLRIARELERFGFSTFMIELPYHMRRTPKGLFSGAGLLNPDLRIFFGALRQAVADVAKMVRGLKAQGYSQIHLCGISLGAYVSTVASSFPEVGEDIDSLSLVMPLVDIGYTFSHSPMVTSGRDLLGRHHIEMDELTRYFAPFKLTRFRPCVPRDRMLLINANHDQVAFAHKVRGLWETLGRPQMFEEDHGHVSMIFALEPFRRMATYLGHRAAQHSLAQHNQTHASHIPTHLPA